ncbi:MAG: FHA domain-containing protein [Planctomycetota bacterium]
MTPLQVHITAGPTAGQRLQINTSPITFGRAPDNTLVLDLPVVSRNHGELAWEEDGQWVLVNHSQNGTRLNRKRVTTKPRPITDPSSVIIGEQEVFRVSLISANTEPEYDRDDEPPTDPDGPAGGKNRTKLWAGLGVWFALCIGMFIFFATLTGGDDGGPISSNDILELTSAEEVRDLIDTPVVQGTPDETAASDALRRARAAYKASDITDMHVVFNSYREAIRFLPAPGELEPLDEQQLKIAEDRLVTAMFVHYKDAYNKLNAGDFVGAVRAVADFSEVFPINVDNKDNPLIKSIQQIRERASSRLE